ncbi:MAG: gluconokinase [Cyclobacteriaceae bacterium]|nr:gluconokinase [Cyclobacteriaceae bacterium]
MNYFLGIDIGTGSTKAVAISESMDEVLSVQQCPYPTYHPVPFASEQDPEKIWEAFVKCVQATVARLGGPPEAIGFSTAMHSVIAVDKNGRPLRNMLTWADGRSASVARSLRESDDARELYEVTGTPIHAMSVLAKLMWLREQEPEIFRQAARFISIKEFIWHRLFGDYEMDYSAASGTGLMDILRREWNPRSLDLAGIKESQLSVLVPTRYRRNDLPETMQRLLTLIPTPWFIVGGGDGCLANLGSNAITRGIACLTIGTSGAIRVASSAPRYDFSSMTFNYILDEKTFICGGPINNGGVILQWYLSDLLGQRLESLSDYASYLSQAAALPPGAGGLIFLPYLMGERAPIWDSRVSGAFFGITTEHRQEHFTRAVIEGISFALYQVAGLLREAGGEMEQINASGGFVHSREWLQILSDIFGMPMHRNNTEDASSIGAALMAARAARNLPTYPKFQPPQPPEVFLPDAGRHNQYQKPFELFRRLFAKTKEEMELLHQMRSES